MSRRRQDNNNWQNQRQYNWETLNERLRSGSTSSLGSLFDQDDNTSGIRFTTQICSQGEVVKDQTKETVKGESTKSFHCIINRFNSISAFKVFITIS